MQQSGQRRGWQDWYHLTLTAYGQWLPGDARGWRTWKHHEHIPGDHEHRVVLARAEGLWHASRERMTYPPVVLTATHREIVLAALRESLRIQEVALLCTAVAPSHAHLLARCVGARPKHVGGAAKHNATVRLRERVTEVASVPAGAREWPWQREDGRRLWARGEHVEAIQDKDHLRNAYRYIVRHRDIGAAVWCADETAMRGMGLL